MTTPRIGLSTVAIAAALLGGCDRPGWTLVWEDDFSGAAGGSLDPASWSNDLGTGNAGWGNGELQYYRAENAILDGDGHLAITARAEDFAGSAYTSARLVTKGKRELGHGRVEARLRLPSGPGIWPAFWLLGADIDSNPWPACGEIDIMELRGQDPGRVLGSLHGPGYFGGGAISNAYQLPGGAGFDDDFHDVAVEWAEGYVAWEVDGATYAVVTRDQLPAGATWVFDRPFFIILNVAVGGSFVGPPDASTMLPQTMLIDRVRTYEADR